MADGSDVATIELARIRTVLTEHGYEASPEGEDVLKVREPDSGLTFRCVLADNILFNSITCTTVPKSAITEEVTSKMLSGDNGISTSAFQLYERSGGKVAVTLNNFCKLLDLGAEDEDDILSCLEFLEIDAFAARELLDSL